MDMSDDNQNAERFHTCEIREKYLPYTCSELTSKHIQFAKKYLNETEETRNKSLRRIKRFIMGELDVFLELEDVSLLSFLRARMFDFKQTCLLMKNFAEFLEINRSYFNRIDTEIMRKVIESKAISILPRRDAKGRAILLEVAENWDTSELKAEDIIFGTVLAFHTALENPLNQVAGYVVIVDCKGVSFSHFRESSSWLIFCVQNLQNCCPAVVQEIHFLHTPYLVLLSWNIVQPILNENVKKVIFFYDSSNWEGLYEKIPPCILPEEIGGHLEPYSYEHWASDVPTMRKKFFDKFHMCLDD